MGVMYQLTIGCLQLLSNSTTCNRMRLMCGPRCAVCLIQFEFIILWFWNSDCSDLFWKEHLKTEPLGTLIEYPALGNLIQMILLFWSGFGGPAVAKGDPYPASFSCCYTITQCPGANSPNIHNPRASLPYTFLCDCTTCCRGLLFSSQCEVLKDISGLWQKPLLLILRCSDACLQPSPKSNHIRCEGVNYKLWNN